MHLLSKALHVQHQHQHTCTHARSASEALCSCIDGITAQQASTAASQAWDLSGIVPTVVEEGSCTVLVDRRHDGDGQICHMIPISYLQRLEIHIYVASQ